MGINVDEINKLPNPLISKKGVILLSEELLYRNPDEAIMRGIFNVFFPIHIEREVERNRGLYRLYGYSPLFRDIEDGEISPEYVVILEHQDDGRVILKDVIEGGEIDGK